MKIVGTFREMFRNQTILLIILNILLLPATGQQLTFEKYTMNNGLVANAVRCIYQDRKGFIWIGTYEGVSRYDGYKFTNYTNTNGLSHNFINSIIQIDDRLLIAENNGAIDIIRNNQIQKRLMAASAVNTITPYKDRLLVTTDGNGLYEIKHDTLISPAQQKTGTALGHFIPINDSLLLCDGVDDHLIVYRKDLSVHSSLKNLDMHFYSLFRDSKKRIWACTTRGLKLLEFSPGKNASVSFVPLPNEFNFSPLTNAIVTSMLEEDDGSFWIGTMKGLVRLFPGGTSHIYNEKDGLPSAMIHTLYIDKEKNLWVGTSLGLAKWVSKNNVVFFNTETKEFKGDVFTMLPYGKRKIILKTEHGLQHFDFATREFRNVHSSTVSYAPIAGTSPLLVHYADKIGIIDSATNIVIPTRKLDTAVWDVGFASCLANGIIFLGGFNGLYAIENTSVQKIFPHRVTSIVIDNSGKVLVGTWSNGLYRIVARSNSGFNYEMQDITPFFRQNHIRSLYTDSKNNIWVGTRYAGAFCLTEKATGGFQLQQFNRQSGLLSDWVTSFAETKTGDMWIGNYLGLDKLVKEHSGYRVFNFGKAVNFYAEIKQIVSTGDNDWVCVANTGIACFKDENLHQALPLQAAILSTSFGVLENKLTILSPTEEISLRPNQNTARFEFTALGFINERQILYSYRLKGSGDTTWSKPENIHEASYASLAPGNYTFEVKTIGWNGEHGTPTAFSFFISTPFWKQWWFIGLVILTVALLFYILYRYRIRELLRLQNVRNSIATDLHDDIGSSLTNISILSELSSKNISQPEKAQPFLQRISEEVQASSQAMDDIIWSVNSRNDSLPETMARMRRYAAELFDNSRVNCHLDLDEKTGNKKLSMEQRRDVYLIYKEALNNIHKHANANNVWIHVIQHQNHLHMQIKDDGKGFNTNFITDRNGLKNLRSRVEKWDGNIRIQSEENKGTHIEIKIPLKD